MRLRPYHLASGVVLASFENTFIHGHVHCLQEGFTSHGCLLPDDVHANSAVASGLVFLIVWYTPVP